MSKQPEETYESIHFAKLCYTVRMNVCITSELEKSVTARGKEPPTKGEVCAQLAALEKPLRERGLKFLAVFGSVVRGTARSDSDVDVLIDIEPDTQFSLIDLVELKDFLEDRLDRRVDVVTKAGLEPRIRDRVIREAARVF